MKSNVGMLFIGLIVLLGIAVFAVDSMPWAKKAALEDVDERVKSLEVQKNFTNEGYRDFEVKLGRIDERTLGMEKDIVEIKEMLHDHQRNHHN